MAQITSQGIEGKSLNEYLGDIKTRTLAINPYWNIAADAPDGQRIGIEAELLANLDEGVIEAYRSKDPDSATGVALRIIGKISGVPIKEATFSVAPVTITGTVGVSVPAGSIIRSRIDNTQWALNGAIVIGTGQTGSGFATCLTAGRVLASAGELTIIGEPYGGWSSVTNPLPATAGDDAESDSEFRARRNNSVSKPGSNMLDNMYANVASVAGVTDVKVDQNIAVDPVDSDGIPYRSIYVIVNGGSDQDIALAMYEKKNPGVPMYPRYNQKTDTWIDTIPNGVVAYVTSPVTGNVEAMTFQRAIALNIFPVIVIKKVGTLPSDIADRLKAAIVADSTKNLFDGNVTIGFNQNGYEIGEVVPPGRLYTPINKVLGLYGDSYIQSLTIGRSVGAQGVVPIEPEINELATFDPDNIFITVV